MKGKNYGALLATLGMMAAMGNLDNNQGRQFDVQDVEPPKKVIPKGCKEYSLYGFTVIAINEKSARRKLDKLASNRKY